jgi:hypothetical protein
MAVLIGILKEIDDKVKVLKGGQVVDIPCLDQDQLSHLKSFYGDRIRIKEEKVGNNNYAAGISLNPNYNPQEAQQNA